MKKISKMDIKQLCQSLESVSDMELSVFMGGGIHYYVDSRGNIEERSGDQYVGYYIYCGSNSLQIGGPLSCETQSTEYGHMTCIFNGSYEIFTFLANNTSVEYGYFCNTDNDNPVNDSDSGFVVTSGEERDGHIGYPADAGYNTQIHSHPRSDGAGGGEASDYDKEAKEEAQKDEHNTIKVYGVYNPYNGEIKYY